MTNEQKVIKYKSEKSLMFFSRYIYKENHNRNFIVAPHLQLIADTLEDVYKGNIKRLIINMPPRYGKTELSIKLFISWCLAKSPSSKFIHLSYSDDLALDNSSQTKEYIESDSFQGIWSMKLKKDAQGKKKWFNELGGGVYATSTGGAITGFGAGSTNKIDDFGGAIIIDDPIKPDDAFSEVKRKSVNERYNNTIRSRVNSRNTPVIVIMQRLHEEDLTGFLLDGGSGEKWNHLCLPALDENNTPLWEQKHTFKELETIRQANRYTFSGQYMQLPSPEEGGEWRKEWFEIIDKKDIPNLQWTLYIDGAYTKNTKNDPTGLQISAKYKNDLIILSSIDKYLEMPELLKFIPIHIESFGINIRLLKVEPKASGKSLAQLIRNETRLNISEIKSDFVNMSKIECARMTSPYIEGGRVKLVKGSWNEHFLQQVGAFPNAKHDEHIDLTCYSVEDNLMRSSQIEIR